MGNDIYDLGRSLLAAVGVWDAANARSGRTTRLLLDSVEAVDVIVVPTVAAKRRHEQELGRLGKRATVFVVAPGLYAERLDKLPQPGSGGQILFDHEWLCLYYTAVLRKAESLLVSA